jgi:putative endonuclease
MNFTAWVYILTNKYNTTLYVGVTTNLSGRLWEHKTKRYPSSFSARYNLNKLVFFQSFETVIEAISHEKFMKGKSRNWKESLIRSYNPDWRDLTDEISDNVILINRYPTSNECPGEISPFR